MNPQLDVPVSKKLYFAVVELFYNASIILYNNNKNKTVRAASPRFSD